VAHLVVLIVAAMDVVELRAVQVQQIHVMGQLLEMI
jgi:hypothetical protein